MITKAGTFSAWLRRGKARKKVYNTSVMSMRYVLIIPFLILLATVIGSWLFSHKPRPAEIVVGDELYSLEIADTPDEHGKGLGGRDALATSSGMLFIFEKPSTYGFWMRDMRFPIDIGWLDDDFCLVYDVRNVFPESYPEIFSPPLPVRYVLEVNAGVFDSAEVTEGACFEVFWGR